MKKIILLSFACAVSILMGHAQTKKMCGTDEHSKKWINDPKTQAKVQAIEAHTQKYVEQNLKSTRSNIYEIRVIVHIMYQNAEQNLSKEQIESQIKVLNRDFRKRNADIKNLPEEFKAADTKIEFVLDRVTRKKVDPEKVKTVSAVKHAAEGGVDVIEPKKYLNLWVIKLDFWHGLATFPGEGPEDEDGIMISNKAFGSSDFGGKYVLSKGRGKGRVLVHEIGHYLNLKHVWGDGDCSVDDFVEDTPISAAANEGCPSYPSKSCDKNGGFKSDMFMNYMDYTDDKCIYAFTPGQSKRMDAVLASGGARRGLVSMLATNLKGTYRFRNVATDQYLDADANGVLKVAASNTKSDQKWAIKKSSGNYYYNIDNISKSRGVLQVLSSNKVKWNTKEAVIKHDDKQWKAYHLGGKYYRFQDKKSGSKYLAVNKKNKSIISSTAKNNTSKWELVKVKASKASQAEEQALSSNTKTLTVYPNPSSGMFSIEAEGMQLATLSIYDINGKQIYQQTNTEGAVELDKSELFTASGIYLIKAVDTEGKVYAKKLMIK